MYISHWVKENTGAPHPKPAHHVTFSGPHSCDSEECRVCRIFIVNVSCNFTGWYLEQVQDIGSIYELFIGACCPINYLKIWNK